MNRLNRSILHTWVERLIRRLKHDASYSLDSRISISDLLGISARRGAAMLRGALLRFQFARSEGLLFAGKNINLLHKKSISVGRSVIIEDSVFMDALSQNGIVLGNNVTIAKFSSIQCTGVIHELGTGVTIGDNSAVGAYAFLGGQGGIMIGNNVIMGPKVNIFSENHGFDDLSLPIRLQPTTRKSVVIDDNCWIGANSTILAGVHIGQGCVIAAGSVVTKDLPINSIAAGIPARVIRQRGHA
jgi:acetyltransferase-like isoleucine patch superfamily enzyme